MVCVPEGYEYPEPPILSHNTGMGCEQDQFDPPLDGGIAAFVAALRDSGIQTFESCEGGPGHAYAEPTVRFHGNRAEGLRALAAAMHSGLPVAELRRVWPVIDGEPTGPWWEMTLARKLD